MNLIFHLYDGITFPLILQQNGENPITEKWWLSMAPPKAWSAEGFEVNLIPEEVLMDFLHNVEPELC